MANSIVTHAPPVAPTKCAIEGCATRTIDRRCREHQAQLERNLRAVARGGR